MTEHITRIKLNDVRLSYPAIFQPRVGSYNNTPEYNATFILDKVAHIKEITTINNEIDKLLAANNINRSRIKRDKLCLLDGDLTDKQEYQNAFTLKASSKYPVPIVHNDARTIIKEEDQIIYGGCYVSAYIQLRFYNFTRPDMPKIPLMGIKATMTAVQFRKDGPRFSSVAPYVPQDITGAFDPVDSDNTNPRYVSTSPTAEHAIDEDLF